MSYIFEERPWGRMVTLVANRKLNDGSSMTVKILKVDPGNRLSDQKHLHREEHWTAMTDGASVLFQEPDSLSPIQEKKLSRGDEFTVPKGWWHRLVCDKENDGACEILEVSFGNFSEDDIIRRSDDFGRSQ